VGAEVLGGGEGYDYKKTTWDNVPYGGGTRGKGGVGLNFKE